jgi:hypothetical protein
MKNIKMPLSKYLIPIAVLTLLLGPSPTYSAISARKVQDAGLSVKEETSYQTFLDGDIQVDVENRYIDTFVGPDVQDLDFEAEDSDVNHVFLSAESESKVLEGL